MIQKYKSNAVFFNCIFIGVVLSFFTSATGQLTPQNVELYIESLHREKEQLSLGNFDIEAARVRIFSLESVLVRNKFDKKAGQWAKARTVETLLLLKMVAIIKEQLAQPFDKSDRPLMSITPPKGSGFQLPVDPKEIKDPKLRQQYEKEIEENRQKIQTRHKMHRFQMYAPDMFARTEQYIVALYSNTPFYPNLESLLRKGQLDEPSIVRVLDAVNEQIKRSR